MPYPDQLTDAAMAEIDRRINANNPNILDSVVGESVFDRTNVAIGTTSTTQVLKLVGFTARSTQNISQIRVVTNSTAAAATPTLCRFGVYSRDSANLYTLVASTVNDTALFAAANTTYSKAFSTAFLKTAGTDYLVGMLIVSGAAFPTFCAPVASAAAPTAYSTDVYGAFPQLSGQIAAQADLPATFTSATVAAAQPSFHALLLQ